jgi:hypothetical protein
MTFTKIIRRQNYNPVPKSTFSRPISSNPTSFQLSTMTGAVGAASLALAVLPVVESVAESFSAASRALKRYRLFSSEIGRLSKFVKLQRTIFHGEIRSLLASCVGWDQAEQLLQDTDCPGWNDECLEENFASRLGSTRDSFLELVDLINSELSGMEARLKGFEEVA